MDTLKKRTFLDIPKEIFRELQELYGSEVEKVAVNFKGEPLMFDVVELASKDKQLRKPKIGLFSDKNRSIFVVWTRKDAPGNTKPENVKEYFFVHAFSIPLTEEQESAGEAGRFEIRFKTNEGGIDPNFLVSDLAVQVLGIANTKLQQKKGYYRVIYKA